MTVKTLLLNGKPVSAGEDQSLLDVAREHGARSRPSATWTAFPTSGPVACASSR